jgi:hypothetical protein
MKLMKKLISYLGLCLGRWLNAPYKTRIVEEELPRHLVAGVLYIVQDNGFLEQAAMICPCGCKKTLHMNLNPDERPYWKLMHHKDGTSTLHPSVWRKNDCRSHFWFRRGRVQWCYGRGPI